MNNLVLLAQNNEGDAAVGGLLLLAFVCIGLLFYFLPAVIAVMRQHQNTAAIFVLTLLLGWTFLGWVCALVWSFTAVERRGRRSQYDDD